MRHLPRLAVGTIQPQARREPLVWGLFTALHRLEASPIMYRAMCSFGPHDVARSVSGRRMRHLDSWAMTRQAAGEALSRAVGSREVAVVEGEFDCAQPTQPASGVPASSLDTLCDWLDLPRIGIVDVTRLAPCEGTPRPQRLDGLILDRVKDAGAAAYWQTTLESLWQIPVLGWLDEAAPLRAHCTRLPAGTNPARELCEALAARLLPNLNVERLMHLACHALPLSVQPDESSVPCGQRPFRIAVAFDETYCGYFPETLDLLESAGAELCDFSPLKSGTIPADVDCVYFGCGHPEKHSAELAANHCLKQSLRCFAAGGGRIYAEGSGLAYLCRDMVFPCGNSVPMTGLLPATARWLPQPSAPQPTEIEFGAPSWLIASGTRFRGYRHNGWQIEPRGPMITYALDHRQRLDVLGRGNVIGSLVLVNLAANKHLLRRFFDPYAHVASSARGDT